MATKRQIEANRANAKKSTGPRTLNGKQVSSQNSRKTGIFCKQALLPEEDGEEFARLRAEYYDEWTPLGATERLLVERLVVLAWRMARCSRDESGMIDALRYLPKGKGGIAAAYLRDARNGDSLGRVVNTEAASFKSYTATIHTLQKLQETRSKRHTPSGQGPTPATL